MKGDEGNVLKEAALFREAKSAHKAGDGIAINIDKKTSETKLQPLEKAARDLEQSETLVTFDSLAAQVD